MILSHRHRLIFIKTSKTAGTSIELALEPICGPEDVCAGLHKHAGRRSGRADEYGYRARNYRGLFVPRWNPDRPWRQFERDLYDLWRGRKFYNHMSAFEVRARAGRQVFDSYFKFCFERNPWDKAVSQFFWEKGKPGVHGDFETFVRSPRLRSRFDLYAMGGKPVMDYIGRYETLEEDFCTALTRAGIAEPPALPRAKAAYRPEPADYRKHYSPQSRDAVARKFAREIELFGYSF
ncbi:MAG: hypothetical protein ACT4OG_08895 [Alphaproteobacteria bacterium]